MASLTVADITGLKVADLRSELAARGRSTEGLLKAELATELAQAVAEEEQAAKTKKRKANQTVSAEFHTSVAECPVCLVNMDDEIYSCKDQGHNICGECLKQLDRPKKCPECRGPISTSSRNRAIERVVAQIQLPCKWAADSGEGGCDFEGTKDPRSAHEQTCEFRRFECPFNGCQATMLSSEMSAHIESAHPDQNKLKRVTKCFQRVNNIFRSTTKDWPTFVSSGDSFSKCYRFEDRGRFGDQRHALVSMYFTIQKGDDRAVIGARLLAATKEMDVEKLLVEVKVPLKDGQAVTLYLKPTRSTGNISGDLRQLGAVALATARSASPRAHWSRGLTAKRGFRGTSLLVWL
eukprot:CAMPEP_0119517218 /NCGR_PEP_ID=MMETSP1344-20130328/34173_1 /TAXON_ID=236787 /ORGANISM="Florenciella parvula, Strain CCMP2471" /LENGTH=349 /DNA_ID=CAMNT_0007554785 /DNA_START=18 /DNA_END=1068 /DNA_ORIENTATION=+